MPTTDDDSRSSAFVEPAMARARELLAEVARRRASGWSTLVMMFSEPTRALLDALRTRSIFGDLSEAIGWMDSDRDAFLPHAAALDAFAQTTDPDGVLERLRADNERLTRLGGTTGLVAELERLSTLCLEEREAWSSGDDSRAKALRLEEHRLVQETAAGGIPAFCERVLASDLGEPYPSAAGILLELLRVESGRDYHAVLRGVLPDGAG